MGMSVKGDFEVNVSVVNVCCRFPSVTSVSQWFSFSKNPEWMWKRSVDDLFLFSIWFPQDSNDPFHSFAQLREFLLEAVLAFRIRKLVLPRCLQLPSREGAAIGIIRDRFKIQALHDAFESHL